MSDKKNIELPIRVCEARKRLNVGETYMRHLMRAMGRPGVRRVMMSDVVKWLRANPTWVVPRRMGKL